MAAQTCAKVQTATLSGTTADSVTFSKKGSSLAVTNHHATEKLYFRADGTTAVAAADESYIALPGQTKVLSGSIFGGNMSLSIVGNGNIYTAEIF